MILAYFSLIILIIYKCKFAGKSFFKTESVSKPVTDSVKGIFILCVFISHFFDYITCHNNLDILGLKFSYWLGQLIVACFLFYSGFGIHEAIRNKRNDYIQSFPKKRILKTLFSFDIAVCFYLIMQFCFNEVPSLKTILLSFIGWESLGNSNWYIFVILSLYTITYLVFSVIKQKIVLAISCITFASGLLIAFLYLTKSSCWYDTILCYALGMWFSFFKNRFFAFLCRNNYIWALITFCSILSFGLLHATPHMSLFTKLTILITPLVFCLMIVLILLKIRISNQILLFFGRHLFEIFILQRLPMIILKRFGVDSVNTFLYFSLCLLCTVLLAVVFHRVLVHIQKRLFLSNHN